MRCEALKDASQSELAGKRVTLGESEKMIAGCNAVSLFIGNPFTKNIIWQLESTAEVFNFIG